MSLINDVLRDLDRRRERPRGSMPSGVRAPGSHPRFRSAVIRVLPWFAGLGILGGAALMLHLWLEQQAPGTGGNVPEPANVTALDIGDEPVEDTPRPRLEQVDVRNAEADDEGLELRFITEYPLVHTLERASDGRVITLALPVDGEGPELPDLLREVPEVVAVDWRFHGDRLTLKLEFETAPRLQVQRLSLPAGVALAFDFPADPGADDEPDGDGETVAETAEPGAGTEPEATRGDQRADRQETAEALVESPLGVPAAEAGDGVGGELVRRPSRAGDADGALRRARAAEDAGDIREAEAIYRDGLAETPDAWRLRRGLAALLHQRGETESAAGLLAEGLEDERGAPALARLKARILMEHDPERAIRVLEAHPASSFGDGGWHALLAALYRQTGQAEDAVPLYRELARQQSSEGRWWLGLGVALEESDEADRARAAYERALTVGGLDSELTAFLRQRIETLE